MRADERVDVTGGEELVGGEVVVEVTYEAGEGGDQLLESDVVVVE